MEGDVVGLLASPTLKGRKTQIGDQNFSSFFDKTGSSVKPRKAMTMMVLVVDIPDAPFLKE